MLLHSLAPWFLARHQPNLVRVACASLTRVGFEAWYPTIVELRPLPLRKIAPTKRHRAAFFLREVRRPRFVGYILIRMLPHCQWDVNRINELSGCGSIVRFAGTPAKIQDFDVEIMRIAEATGQFDTVTYAGPPGRYRISRTGADTRWTGQGKQLLGSQDARGLRLAVDAFGRVARIIEEADEPPAASNQIFPAVLA
jgi:hypothetical protein